MPDGTLSEAGEPRGRAAEIVRLLRELGFAVTAEVITADILLRRRSLGGDPIAEHVVQSGTPESPRTVWESVSDESEESVPLTDEEVREAIGSALEETIVSPLRMLEEVTTIVRALDVNTRRESLEATVPQVQLEGDTAPVAWCSPAAFRYATEFEQLLPRIMEWLSASPAEGG
jgi:hypothetical protein